MMKRILTLLAICAAVLGVAAPSTSTAQAQGSTLTGRFVIIEARDYQNPLDYKGYALFPEPTDMVALNVEESLVEARGGEALNGQTVTVTFAEELATTEAAGTTPTVIDIHPVTDPRTQAPETTAVTGSQPFAWVLCQFPGDDSGTSETRSVNYFQGMYSNSYPGLNDYWRKISYNQINIDGSKVMANGTNWYTMPLSQSNYPVDRSNPSPGLTAIFNDCTAQAVADGESFTGIQGINIILDESIGCCAWGGGGVTWEPPWAWQNITVFSHEMGHAFGLPHSNNTDGDSSPYDNPWDVMSGAYDYVLTNATYGKVGLETNAYHKDILGWMGGGRKVVHNSGSAIYQLEALSIQSNGILKMIQIPGADSGQFYTVEARKQTGYDAGIPSNAVIIYEIKPSRAEDAWIQGSSDAFSTAVRWTPGETWSGNPQNFKVRILAETATGFTVCVQSTTTLCPPTTTGANVDVLGNATITWVDNAPDEAGFIVQRAATASGPWSDIAFVGANQTSFVDSSPLCTGNTATYRVVSVNGSKTGYSDPIQTNTYVCPPTLTGATFKADTDTVDLTWQDNSGNETGFIIQRGPSDSGPWSDVAFSATNTTQTTDTSVACTAGDVYYRTVSLTDGAIGYSGVLNTQTYCGPFADVPIDLPAPFMESWVVDFYNSGITTGCGRNEDGNRIFCPARNVTRADMAVFILRALEYPRLPYDPPGDPTDPFIDVFTGSPDLPAPFTEDWIEEFYTRQITGGKGTCDLTNPNPGPGDLIYCPKDPVTRAEMAVFILRALNITPTNDTTDPFVDVYSGSPDLPAPFMEAYIETFLAEGITSGKPNCVETTTAGSPTFCPKDKVTRAEMAVFILRAFDSIPDPEDN